MDGASLTLLPILWIYTIKITAKLTSTDLILQNISRYRISSIGPHGPIRLHTAALFEQNSMCPQMDCEPHPPKPIL